jgi:hypothetical protein
MLLSALWGVLLLAEDEFAGLLRRLLSGAGGGFSGGSGSVALNEVPGLLGWIIRGFS